MAYVRKYLKGRRALSVMEAVREIMEGRYLIWRDKPMHPGWMGSLPVNVLIQSCRHGVVFFAQINPEWHPKASVCDFEEVGEK